MIRRVLGALAGVAGAALLLVDARFAGDRVFRLSLAGRELWRGGPESLALLVPPAAGAVGGLLLALAGGWIFARAFAGRRVAATLLGALVLFPLFDPGLLPFLAGRGPMSAPWYLELGDLVRGLGLGLLWGGLLLALPRRTGEPDARAGADTGTGRGALLGASLFALLLPALVSHVALDGGPLTNDGRSYLFQAELLARGELAHEAGALSDFFPARQVMPGPRAFSKYPPGYAMSLVPGMLVGYPELVPRLLAALVPLLVFRIARRLGSPRPILAAWLAALSPTLLGVGSLYLSHALTVPMCLLFCERVLAALEARERGSSGRACLLGAAAAISIAFLARPLTALAFALPFAVALGLAPALVVVAGAVPGVLLFLWVNHALTGDPFKTAYGLYADRVSPNDRYGLRNLATAVSYTRFNLARLSVWSHGLGGGLLLAAAGWLAPARPRGAALMIAPTGTLLCAYALHRFHGIPWVGPLYLAEGIPLLAVLSASGIHALESARGRRATIGTVALFVLGSGLLLGRHLEVARHEARARTAPVRAAVEAGIERGVVFVPLRTETDRRRFALPPPARSGTELVFARDLGQRNRELLRRLGDPPAFRWDPESGALVPLVFSGGE